MDALRHRNLENTLHPVKRPAARRLRELHPPTPGLLPGVAQLRDIEVVFSTQIHQQKNAPGHFFSKIGGHKL